MVTLRIRLLGGVEVEQDGVRQRVDSGRVESLLAYLLLHRDAPQSRQHLAYLLWPDTSDAQARTNLRHVLHTLRRTLGDSGDRLDVGSRSLQWQASGTDVLDVAEFDAALAQADGIPDGEHRITLLRRAVDLYRGDLVAGCYDEWLSAERETYRQRWVEALGTLASLLESTGQLQPATTCAERLLTADPLREDTYRLLMRLHAARGDRAKAIRVYHNCASTLERELGVPPAAATRQAYDLLLSQDGDEIGSEPLGESPFVGRAAERSAMTAAWRAAEAGRSTLVLLTGEAGIGKTRLVEDFRAWCARRGARTALSRSYAAEGALAYGPIALWLRSTGMRRDLARMDRPTLTQLSRLLPELLVDIPGLPRPDPIGDAEQRQALFDAVARTLLHGGRPLLLVAEDGQWCDRETLQLLHFLLRVAPGQPLLVVITARTEDVAPQQALSDLLRGAQALDRLTEIELGRLSRSDTATLALRLTGPAADRVDADRLWQETEGNPLFVVESLRAGGPLPSGLTPKVQAVIESRLTQLSPPARELLGVAATIGRDFTVELLVDATGSDEDSVVRELDELWRRRLVREQGGTDEIRGYDFSHDKIRAVAYAGVGPIRRRHHHLRIARALERRVADPTAVSAQIAAHYERADAADDAARWYLRAADAAQQLQAGAEAVDHLERARTVLATMPPGIERDLRELEILTALPAPLAGVEGYASARLSAAHDRAIELAEVTGREPASPLLWSLAFSGLVREDFVRAEQFADRLRARGEQQGDAVLIVQGHCLLGLAAFWRADFETARRQLESTVEHYRPEQLSTHLLRYGQDPKVLALARLGNIAWLAGDRVAAVRNRGAALDLADEIGHALTSGAALVFAALLALDMTDDELVRRYADELTALALDARPVASFTRALNGYVEILDRNVAIGMARINDTLDEVEANSPAPGMPAIVRRILLAAGVAAGDSVTGAAAARVLLSTPGPAQVWAAEASRRLADFAAADDGNG